LLAAFRDGLRELGYVEGRNLIIESRYAKGRDENLAQLANELVKSGVDVIFAIGPPQALAAAKATSTIPVVFLAGGTGSARDVIAGLPRPGGNFTGVTFEMTQGSLEPKYLEMLKELVPGLSRVALLRSRAEASPVIDEISGVSARSLGIRLSIVTLVGPEDLKGAFDRIVREKPQGLVAAASGVLYARRRDVIDFAAQNRLPVVYGLREAVFDGGLISLSPSLVEIAARGGFYVDRILKGAKPADLPVEQPTKFELVINMKTARALGLTIPPSILARADHVIQ